MHSKPGFRLCVFRLNGEIEEKVAELTLRACKRLDAYEPRLSTLANVDLPANTYPGQWSEPVHDWCSLTTFPYEHERVVVVHGSHGLWRRDSQGSVFAFGYESCVMFLLPFLRPLFQSFWRSTYPRVGPYCDDENECGSMISDGSRLKRVGGCLVPTSDVWPATSAESGI